MISELYLVMAGFLLANLLIGLGRIYQGPSRANRLLAAQLFNTTTTAILLLLAESMALPSLQDVALLFALLAALTSVAFVRLSPAIPEESD
jgi:multicomponent Na+:H+ antiporter subunit F